MNFSFLIAKRYFLSVKKKNFVHAISLVSLIGIAIGSAALILVLSVFNGFEDLILKMYNSHDPHIKITTIKGKTFNPKSININHPDVKEKVYVLEEDVLLTYRSQIDGGYEEKSQQIAKIKGYSNYNEILSVGRDLALMLGIDTSHNAPLLSIFVPNRKIKTFLHKDPSRNFYKPNQINNFSIFNIHPEINQKYIFADLKYTQSITKRESEVSAIELSIHDEHKMKAIQKQLQADLGHNFLVQNRFQQHELLYKVLNTEKLVIFIILVFILIIASFTVVGAVSILILDKKNDIKTLYSFGVQKHQIKHIFMIKSIMSSSFGALIGITFGITLALIQKKFGLIKMGDGGFIIDDYPVLLQLSDVFFVFLTVFIIGVLASWGPAKFLIKKFIS
jgi:lipoprotein-releasing system permease protein